MITMDNGMIDDHDSLNGWVEILISDIQALQTTVRDLEERQESIKTMKTKKKLLEEETKGTINSILYLTPNDKNYYVDKIVSEHY